MRRLCKVIFMKKFIFAFILFSIVYTAPIYAEVEHWEAYEYAADNEYNGRETEIYVDGYDTGYEEGYAVAEEKYDKTFLYEHIPGLIIGAGLCEVYMRKKYNDE